MTKIERYSIQLKRRGISPEVLSIITEDDIPRGQNWIELFKGDKIAMWFYKETKRQIAKILGELCQ